MLPLLVTLVSLQLKTSKWNVVPMILDAATKFISLNSQTVSELPITYSVTKLQMTLLSILTPDFL